MKSQSHSSGSRSRGRPTRSQSNLTQLDSSCRRSIPSLRDFVLIDPDLRRIEHYRHRGDIGWDIITFEPGDTAQRASVELELPIADVYFKAGVECSA